MKKNTIALFTILATLMFISCGKVETDFTGCYTNIEDAEKAAQKKNQDILVLITMNGDDAYSQPFTDNIIRSEKFKEDILSNYSVVRMDFSQSSYEATVADENSNESAKKNAEKRAVLMQNNTKFANLLSIESTPIVFILSKEKYLITSISYDSLNKTYEDFKNVLDAKADSIDSMHKMIYQTKIGTAEEKMSAINELYEATAPEYRLFLSDLLLSVKKIDPSNKSGLLGKLIYASADAKSIAAVNSGNPREAVDAYLALEKEESISQAERQQALYTAAYLCSMTGLEELPVIIGYLNKAISIDPDSEEVPAIKRVIEALSSKSDSEGE